MRPKIEYSYHARMRMAERDVDEGMVEEAVYGPDYTVSSFEGRKIATRKFGERVLSVAYVQRENIIKVITLYYE